MSCEITHALPLNDRIFLARFSDGEVLKYNVSSLFAIWPLFAKVVDDEASVQVKAVDCGFGVGWHVGGFDFEIKSDAVRTYGEPIRVVAKPRKSHLAFDQQKTHVPLATCG
ncbi:Uncharacterised protein [Slackia heliotrinireducens]|uniref:DUF2442 domain-containing protein n=1 Tax=Slackia heliotrinireducens (strain ATCC 29202 / DSM 20476 / NCTC 11029 / RHS 1) TaxID=471855 RepID=C7N306_SLAHD|nr:hypothetical protein [Slackia heliotrinireducens]ACV21527.1 hypothetical protein Shel_04670 [Slackia heliotrinireducens DSM 20476]VEG98999.1 Uncharacterised protein [Slackia heliotrinireducens]